MFSIFFRIGCGKVAWGRGTAELPIKVNRCQNLLAVGHEVAPIWLKTGKALTQRISVDTTPVEILAGERQVIMIDTITAWRTNSTYTAD